MQRDYERERSARYYDEDESRYDRERGAYGRPGDGGRYDRRPDDGGEQRRRPEWERESYGRGRGRQGGYSGEPAYDREDWAQEGFNRGRAGYGSRSYGDYGREQVQRPEWGSEGPRQRDEGYSQESRYRPSESPNTESWMVPGPYQGRGPRGYQRSDERIREDVSERLTQHGRIDASAIQVEVRNGEVTLSGTVDDRRQKRAAEDVAESVFGVRDIHNRLRATERSGGALAGGRSDHQQVRQGMRVVGFDQHEVGHVKEVHDNDFLIDRAMQRDVCVPFQAIHDVGADQVRLNIPASEVDNQNWPSTGVRTSEHPQQGRASVAREGMDVVDQAGEKMGTIREIFAPAGTREEYLKVDTGVLGLGKDLFVPSSQIRALTERGVVLNAAKDQLEQMGWDRRPAFIPA
jgi:hypothetical protein